MAKENKESKEEKLFRKEALEHLTASEELDKLLQVVTPKKWIALLSFIFIFFSIFLWSIFGKIDTIVTATGIYLDTSKFHTITFPSKGKLVQSTKSIGSEVLKDEVVAVLFDEKSQKNIEIKSPFKGYVVDIHRSRGANVEENDTFAFIQKYTEDHENDKKYKTHDKFYCFMPAKDGDLVNVGMEAHINPWGIKKDIFGYIIGKVETISYLPASEFYFKNIFLSNDFAQHLTQDTPLIPLIITPKRDLENPNKFFWTSGEGPTKNEISLGTFITAKIVVESIRPIYYILPFWYFKKLKTEFHKVS